MAKKYAYEYGRRWNVKTPRGEIGWLIDRLHVGQSDDEVRQEIERRIPADNKAFTPAIRRECGEYALLRHAANCKLYKSVMLGV